MAASVSTALGAGGTVFAVSLGVIYVLAATTMTLGVDEVPEVRKAISRFSATSLMAIAVLVVGSFLDRGPRVVLWLVAAVITVLGMLLAGRYEWIIRSGHFAERHGLIVIIALGEVIVAIGLPVVNALEDGEGLPAPTLVVLVASGVFAALMWWSYFDRPGPAMEHRAEQIHGGVEPGRFARDVYTLAHAPIVAGVVLAAAGIEEIALHPADAVPVAFRAMLAGGLALVTLGIATGIWRSFQVMALERIVATAAIAALLLLADDLAGVTLLVIVDLVILVTLVAEHFRVEHPYRGEKAVHV
jgi:low temperature requirement protein LtrA